MSGSRSRSRSRSSVGRCFVAGVVLICTLLLGSCSTFKKPSLDLTLPRDSFLFILHKVTFLACEEEQCRSVERKAVGSGFVVDSFGGDSWGLTAGHVCMPPPSNHPTKSQVSILLYNGGRHEAEVVGIHPDVDICILRIPDVVLPTVKMASEPPKIGEEVKSLSAPLGTMEPGMLPQFNGNYVGIARNILSPMGNIQQFQAFTIPAAGGVSGAPIFNSQGEVVGMSIIALSRFENFALSPPFESLAAVVSSIKQAARTSPKHGDDDG